VLDLAKQKLQQLETQLSPSRCITEIKPKEQINPIEEKLKQLDLDNLTARNALQTLYDLKQLVEQVSD